jgi:hypothetical protein
VRKSGWAWGFPRMPFQTPQLADGFKLFPGFSTTC